MTCKTKTFGLAALGLLLAFALLTPSTAAAQTWAERLGYPAGKKVLILYIDQVGLTDETNAAAEKLLASEPAKSVGVMMPAPWSLDFIHRNKKSDQHDVGLSLTLTSEYPNYRWKPVLSAGDVPSLVDADSFLWKTVLQFTASATRDDVEREVRAQIQRAKAEGLKPSHLSPHMGALAWRPDLMSLYLETAHKHWIPAVVVELTPERLAEFHGRGYAISDSVVAMIDKYPLPKLDDLKFSPTADSYDAKREATIEMIKTLPAGLTQIHFRPALDGGGLKRFDSDWQQRVWDAQLLSDPKLQELLQGEEIEFTTWKEIMRRFDAQREPPADVEP